jgi:hypothetical protein
LADAGGATGSGLAYLGVAAIDEVIVDLAV